MSQKTSASAVLRELIRESGRTTKAIALDLGISPNTLYAITSKETDLVNLKTLNALAKYFGYDVSVFLGLDQYEPKLKLSPAEKALLSNYRALRPDVAKEVSRIVEKPPTPLTDGERRLLSVFQHVNRQGQEKILDFCADVEDLDRYKKTGSPI